MIGVGDRRALAALLTCGLASCGGEDAREEEAAVDLGPVEAAMTEVSGVAGLYFDPAPSAPACSAGAPWDTACVIASVSGSAAVGDVNGDGWQDVVLGGVGAPLTVFLNRRGRFYGRALVVAGQSVRSSDGVALGDLDADGDLDLVAAALGSARHWLFVNLGDGTFVERGIERGVAAPLASGFHRGTSVEIFDVDADGFLDVVIAQWAPINADVSTIEGQPTRVYRNRGLDSPGFFEETELEGLDLTGRSVFALAPLDFDADGLVDVGVLADQGSAALFRQVRPGVFARVQGHPVERAANAMGSAVGDWNGDGRADWFVSDIACPSCNEGEHGNRLLLGGGPRVHDDGTDAAGVRDGGFAWGAAFGDFDLDGDQDLVQAGGFLYPELGGAASGVGPQPVRLWENDGRGRARDVAQERGLGGAVQGRGVALIDFDRDGDEDIIVAVYSAQPRLYRNDAAGGNRGIRVRLRDGDDRTPGARDGRGVRVEVDPAPGVPTMVRWIGSQGQFQGQSEAVATFGGGSLSAFQEVRVGDGGRLGVYRDVPAGAEIVAALSGPALPRVHAWLSLRVRGEGTTDPPPGLIPVREGTAFTAEALPAPSSGAALVGWEGPGSGLGRSRVVRWDQVEAGSTVSLAAVFEPAAGEPICLEAGEGGVTWPAAGCYTLAESDELAMVAVARPSHRFVAWQEPGGPVTDLAVSARPGTGPWVAVFEPADYGVPAGALD